jgi:ubiquitin carboxyl-terminal hydrolase 5/13
MHYHKSQHPIALNIKLIEKQKDPETKKEQQAVTKLAIGKPGGIDADTDDYDTVVALKCVACNIELDRTEPQIASLIDSILLTQSAYYVNTVEEWELKLDPCEHTLTLN